MHSPSGVEQKNRSVLQFTGLNSQFAYTVHMQPKDYTPWYVSPKSKCQLSDFDTVPPAEGQLSGDELDEHLADMGEKLDKLQSTLHAAKTRGLLVVFQGMDTSGKDGVIRSVFTHVSPLGVRAEAFGVPTDLESRHDFLWRIHAKAPARGEMVIFNRSHYEDVLVTRVRGLIDEETCQQRYDNILHFESLLHNAGISVLKCYLHISKSEQKKRLQARIDDPRKHWKLQPSDFDDRELWPKFTQAYEEALSATSTPESPWYVVPADSKPYRDSFVAGLIVQTLENMKLKPPKPSFDLSKVKL
jgi:PPK2 family polyphosphate:nucleotide phosphotransferase